ncbi:MAG: UbiX family flavin prenyltransferase [Trueperaceae bacterium]|nr:UbiX family flavin prenyltransferase [Trueperaceae bacterium]
MDVDSNSRGALPSVVVAVSGASGMIYAQDLLENLRAAPVRVDLVVTAGAKQVLASEEGVDLESLTSLADQVHKDTDLGAAFASGSRRPQGMVVVPCSAGTLAQVAQGMTSSLVTRAAHVCLKERAPLVLVVREAPYSRPMLVNMLAANDAGAVILPASPGFYHRPTTISDLVGSVTARALDHIGIRNERVVRWRQDEA